MQGVGDQGATPVGVGAAEAGTLYAYLGTSGWLAVSRDEAEPLAERGVFTICHAQPGRWIQVAPVLTAGGNLDWLRQVLVPLGQPLPAYDALDALAAGVRPGSGGVLYLPYLNGERSPFNAPQARAGFLGISGATTQAELVREAMEGVAYAYRALREAIGVVQRGPLRLAGGGGQSAVWAQILADVVEVSEQVVADQGDAPAGGAALVAGQALGWYSSLAPVEHVIPVAATYVPNPRHLQRYDHLYGIFVGVYPALRSAFAALAQEERSSR